MSERYHRAAKWLPLDFTTRQGTPHAHAPVVDLCHGVAKRPGPSAGYNDGLTPRPRLRIAEQARQAGGPRQGHHTSCELPRRRVVVVDLDRGVEAEAVRLAALLVAADDGDAAAAEHDRGRRGARVLQIGPKMSD